jgi:hypothetical protein
MKVGTKAPLKLFYGFAEKKGPYNHQDSITIWQFSTR